MEAGRACAEAFPGCASRRGPLPIMVGSSLDPKSGMRLETLTSPPPGPPLDPCLPCSAARPPPGSPTQLLLILSPNPFPLCLNCSFRVPVLESE